MQAAAYTYHIPYPGLYSAAAWPFYLPSMSAAYHHQHAAASLLPPTMPPNICSSSPPSPIAPRNLTLRPSSRTGRQGKAIFYVIIFTSLVRSDCSKRRRCQTSTSGERTRIQQPVKMILILLLILMLLIHCLVLLLSLLSIS